MVKTTYRTRYEFTKYCFDRATAAGALLVCSPVIAVVATAIRWRMGTPIFFRQERPGRGGIPFTMVKFRTMERSQVGGVAAVATDAQRITSLGRFLRKTSLDELPTLWNVLKGDMSLVGPRPLLMEYLPHFSARHNKRHLVRPGVTGLAQIKGRNALTWEQRLNLDAEYVERRSTMLDFSIIGQTFSTVLRREGIHSPGCATSPVLVPLSQELGA